MIDICELFSGIQGEGVSAGNPAVFFRVPKCNLKCGNGPNATWSCDTENVMKGKSKKYSNEELELAINKMGEIYNIYSGSTHLVFTGGEPTLPIYAKGIIEFLDYLFDKQEFMEYNIYSELETNGSVNITEKNSSLFDEHFIDQINCSPKLSNSGMSKEKRINPDTINRIMTHPNYWFKIVISDEKDIEEFIKDFSIPFAIPDNKIILMPAADNRDSLISGTKFVIEMAKKYNLRMCSRLHILAYDKKKGV